MQKIKVGIVGYGNLGRGAEIAISKIEDFELVGIFTRREPKDVKPAFKTNVFKLDECLNFKDKIDVMLLCGGSANDLQTQSPEFAEHFNIIDSYDNHKLIPEHFARVDEKAKKGKKVGIISIGWDPGLFSLNRLYAMSVLDDGKEYTFWGKGVSQGHSDAIRRVKGVKDARQYTIPSSKALDEVRSGLTKDYTTREKHIRECFVVLENDTKSQRDRVENEIKTMPNYFEPYDTSVNFITQDELDKNHSKLSHGGHVIRVGKTGVEGENTNSYEFSLKLDSNSEFTSSVMVAYIRAAYRLEKEQKFGATTILEIPPCYTSSKSIEELRESLL